MTLSPLTNGNDDTEHVLDQLEAWALGALDSFDRGMVEHHLRWCDDCRLEAAAWSALVRHLGLATPLTHKPHPAVKQRLLSSIGESGRKQPLPLPDQAVPSVPSVRTSTSFPANSSRLQRYAAASLILPLALAVLVLGVWSNSLKHTLDQQEDDLSAQVAFNQALLNGQQVQLYTVQQTCPTCRGNGQLGISNSDDMGMFLGWDFDPEQQHDVWQVNGQGVRTRVCQLHVDREGGVMQMFHLPEAPGEFADVYITDADGVLIYQSRIGGTNDEAAPTVTIS